MARRVPLARRNLFAERRHAALAVAGIAVAMLLVLVLDGIFAGTMRQVTAYLRTSPADAIVSQQSVRTMHMSASALPASMVDAAWAVPEAAWVEPIRFTSGIVSTGTDRQLSYVIGYRPGHQGGPRHLVAGTEPGAGQAVLDELAADQLRVHVGDQIVVLGTPFRVAGLSSGGSSITNTTTFVTFDDFGRLRGDAVSYVLVGAKPGVTADALRDALARALPDTTVQTRAEFIHQERAIVGDMSADTMRIMGFIGFAIALAVVGLTLFTATLAHLREYGVVKALGARPARLAGIVLTQAAWAVALALILAVALAVGVGAAVGRMTPTVSIAIEPSSILRVAYGAAIVGAAGAVLPLRRVLALDPAAAFLRPT